ncbi:MAG: hypothetical protein J3K34DRAFT_522552 [Monoraphidium minutum]|nr:MAG: hypothetical protein J3K34DRAFT_522552 [Monoraphidium minutum]
MDAEQAQEGAATTIKVAGAISGVVQLAGAEPTVGALRAECARVAGTAAPAIKLICGGKTLQDDAKPLSEYRVGAASRVLVTKGAGAAAALGAAAAEQQRRDAHAARLEKLKAVADKLSGRGDGRGLTDKYEFDLQNQDGTRLALDPADRRALVMGLALHAKGQASLAAALRAARAGRRGGGDGGGAGAGGGAGPSQPAGGAAAAGPAGPGYGGEAGEKLRAALEELLLAEEAFDLVGDKQLLQAVDNVAMLLLDIVWCSYLLRDVGRLGRVRMLHGGFSPEIATYVRLEAMEGVVAFHVGDRDAAARHLAAAQERYQKLQVSPQSLAALREMGYSKQEASRALRFCSGDVGAAVPFIADQRQRQEERAAERRRQRSWLSERAAFGKTPRGVYVDRVPLEQLVGLGYERGLAAEALRAAENDLQAALDTLGDAVKSGALQLAVLAQQIKEEQEGPQQDVKAKHVRRLVEMGFPEKAARLALRESGGSFEDAVEQLAAALGGGDAAMADAAGGGAGGSSSEGSSSGGSSASSEVDSEAERLEASLVDVVRGGGDDPTAAYDVDLEEEAAAVARYTAALSQQQGR